MQHHFGTIKRFKNKNLTFLEEIKDIFVPNIKKICKKIHLNTFKMTNRSIQNLLENAKVKGDKRNFYLFSKINI